MMLRRLETIVGELGHIFILFAIMLVSPLISLFWYPAEYETSLYFIIPALICAMIGWFLKSRYKESINYGVSKTQQGIIIFITWFLACVILTIPFISADILNFSQAFFETSSGLSTTGLSVVDVTSVDKMFLMYRSMIQFFGGIGIILVLVTLFTNMIGFELFQAEGHGERLTPNVKESARLIVKIYVFYILVGALALVIVGMPSFDAVNIAICAVATGGFGVTPGSIADYQSTWINLIIVLLMLVGSLSFYTNLLIIKGHLKTVFKINEVKLFLKIIVILIIASFLFTLKNDHGSVTFDFSALEIAIFEIVSAITGTGFSITTYQSLYVVNQTMYLLVIVAMIIGGATGSTAGGIKITRVNIMYHSIKWNIKKIYSPVNKLISRSIITPIGKQQITNKDIVMAANYVCIYFIAVVVGTVIFTIFGYDVAQSLFEVTSAIGNVGLSTGITAPDMPVILLWTLSFLMFIGRLEIFLVIGFMLQIIAMFKKSVRRISFTRK